MLKVYLYILSTLKFNQSISACRKNRMLKSNVAESFFLTKNNYEDSTKNIFKTLLKDVEFSDVTLALNDENQVKGHKAILGASSSFFRKIFQQNSDANLVLYLKGINSPCSNCHSRLKVYVSLRGVNNHLFRVK